MQYSLVDNVRIEATKGARGICPICNAEMIAKCGPRIINHWAHNRRKNCDPWWENETEWHRNWKNQYPEDCREVSHLSEEGEIHRADVKTSAGIVIEFQNSPMSDIERVSRENFYKNLVWVVNAEKFKNNFDLHHQLPNPDLDVTKDLVWFKSHRSQKGTINGMCWRRSQNPGVENQPHAMVLLDPFEDMQKEIKKMPTDYYQYDWIKPRSTWLEAECPVYLDFGDDYLVLLEKYPPQLSLRCVRVISKRIFLQNSISESLATNIAKKLSLKIENKT